MKRHRYEGYAEHRAPARADRADSVVYVELPDDPGVFKWEQLPARRVSADHYEICAVPFFAYDLALGDIVETSRVTGHGIVNLRIERVVSPSGHETYRVRFHHDVASDPEGTRLLEWIQSLGCEYELWSPRTAAIDTDDDNAQVLADYLWDRYQAGAFEYETGRTV